METLTKIKLSNSLSLYISCQWLQANDLSMPILRKATTMCVCVCVIFIYFIDKC